MARTVPGHSDATLTAAARWTPSRYEALVAAALDAIVIIDSDGRVIEFNPAAEALFGYSHDDVVGQQMENLIVPERLRHAHNGGIARYLATGEGPALNRRVEVPAIRADGTEIIVELIAIPLETDGRVEFAAFLRDLTEVRRANESVARSEERYRTLINRAQQSISILDADGNWVTSTGSAFLGHPAGFDPPGGIFALIHADDRERALSAFANVVAGSRAPDEISDFRVRNSDGEYRTCAVSGENLLADPSIEGVVLRAWDVTEERARESLLRMVNAQLRTVIGVLPLAVMVEDAQDRVAMVNELFVKLMKWDGSPDDLVGTDLHGPSVWPVHLFEDPVEYARRAQQLHDERNRGTDEIKMLDGRVFRRDCIPIEVEGSFAGLLWMYREETEEFNYMAALAEQNRALEQLTRLKNEFVATVSHELRTPLTSVISFGGLLREPEVGELNEEQSGLLDVIDRNAQRLLRLIGDLLLLAKLESNSLSIELETLDLPTIVLDAVAEVAPSARLGDVLVSEEIGLGPRYVGDAVRLHQVMNNLLDNAVKFTPAGGNVRVHLSSDPQAWTLTVADSGIGIPAGEQHRVFTSFYRGSNTRDRKAPGTGLGLAITKVIVELHGGSISVASEQGVGTTMTVILPIRAGGAS